MSSSYRGRSSKERAKARAVITGRLGGSRGYSMGKYEVTQGEYEAVMGNNPSYFNGVQTNWPNGDFGTDLTRPV